MHESLSVLFPHVVTQKRTFLPLHSNLSGWMESRGRRKEEEQRLRLIGRGFKWGSVCLCVCLQMWAEQSDWEEAVNNRVEKLHRSQNRLSYLWFCACNIWENIVLKARCLAIAFCLSKLVWIELGGSEGERQRDDDSGELLSDGNWTPPCCSMGSLLMKRREGGQHRRDGRGRHDKTFQCNVPAWFQSIHFIQKTPEQVWPPANLSSEHGGGVGATGRQNRY